MESALTYYNREIDTDFYWHFIEDDSFRGMDDEGEEMMQSFEGVEIEEFDALTEERYFLMSPWLPGFMLQDKVWRKSLLRHFNITKADPTFDRHCECGGPDRGEQDRRGAGQACFG